MSIEEQYELFEAYFDKSLTTEEQGSFDELMQTSEGQTAFEEYSSLQKSFATISNNEKKEIEFIKNLESIKHEFNKVSLEDTSDELKTSISSTTSKPTFKINKTMLWGLSAAAVIILGFFATQKILNPKQSMQSLYASNFNVEALSIERGNNDDSLNTITTLFNSKKYQEVYPILQSYSNAHADITNLKLAVAICEIELNNTHAAETSLQQLIQQHDAFEEKAQWYLALVYLKEKEKEKAVSLLKEFKPEHFYFAKAKDILKELE